MTPVKILKKEIPEIKHGNCASDPSISENHVQVLTHICMQMDLIVNGMNDHMERMDNAFDRVAGDIKDAGKETAGLRRDVARWHEEFALTAKDLNHLESDVDRLGKKVVRMEEREWGEHSQEALDVKTDKRITTQRHDTNTRAFLSPIWSGIVGIVLFLIGLGIISVVQEKSAQATDETNRQIIQDTIKQLVQEELKGVKQ